jgi:cysteine desulfurase
MAALKEQLWEGIRERIPAAVQNGPTIGTSGAAPHILSVSLPPVRSQTMLFALEGDGIYVSAGSACASHSQRVSPVLTGMGMDRSMADCTLRFSFGIYNTEEEISYTVERIAAQYAVLSKYIRK